MSSVVLDASFIVKLLVEEPGSVLSKAVFETYEHAGARFLVPGHAMAETLEVVRRKIVKGMATRAQLEHAATILPKLADAVPLLELLEPGVSIALGLRITLYDALYVALADQQSGVLLTADIRLVGRLRGTPFEHLALGVDASGLNSYGPP